MDLYDMLDEDKELYNELEIEDERSNSKYDKSAYINRALIYSNKYEKAFIALCESPKTTRQMIQSSRTMLEHHHGDKYEDLYFINSITNEMKSRTDYLKAEKQVEPSLEMKKMDMPNTISIHNHPTNGMVSMGDILSCIERNYKYGLIVCHNGSIYKYQHTGESNYVNLETSLNIYERAEAELSGLVYDMDLFISKHKENFNELSDICKEAGITLTEVLWYADK